jgi:hypothetical protein
MKNNSFSRFVRRPTLGRRICECRMFCLALLFVALFSGLGLAQDAPAANVTGTGTADFIPRWTGTTTIGNSIIFQTVGGLVGIGTTTPGAKLDVKGAFNIHGSGFSIDPTGKVHFVAGQTFPGAGTVTSVGSGAGLTGGPITTSGTLSIATSGVTNAMLANPSLTVTAGTALTGGGSVALGGSTTLNVDTTQVPLLGAFNTFTSGQVIDGNLTVGGSGNFSHELVVNVGNSLGLAVDNTSSSETLSLQNFATPANSNFTEAQFNKNGTATFFTDTLGDTTAIGTKHAAVPLQNGQMVDVSSMESPEVWFEDFGSGQLTGGITTVSIDASFSQIVSLPAGYHVFITPKGDCKGLFVANETGNSFEIRELSGGQSSVEFDYRIVAHRKGYEQVRLPLARMPKPQRYAVK